MSARTTQTTTLRDYWRVLKRRRSVVILAVVATVGAAVAASLLQSPVYSAESEILVQSTPGESLFGSAGVAVDESNQRGDNAITVLKGEAVSDYVRETLGLTSDPPAPDGKVVGDTNVVLITVEAGEAESAALLANTYADALIDVRREQSTAGLGAAASELETRIANLDQRIEQLDTDIAESAASLATAIADRQAQVDELNLQMLQLQRRASQLDAQAGLSLAEQIERDELTLTMAATQADIDAVRAEIDDLRGDGSELLQQSRQALFDQQAQLTQRLDEVSIDAALATGSAQVVRTADVPDEPARPRPIFNALLAVVVGLIIGMAAAFLREYFDDSIKAPADLAKLQSDVPLLAVVPSTNPPDDRPLALSQPESLAVEAYRNLRTNVQFLGIEREVRVIEVVSAKPGEGKTTVATNLAVVLSQTGATVALVDADLRKPRVHRVFSIDRTYGLTTNLAGESIDMTMQPMTEHLSVLVAGPIPPNPSELLSSRRMGAIIAELRRRFDYVVIDSAPMLAVTDALALAQHADGVVVVAQSGRTAAGPLNQALSSLEQVSAPVLGIVLNRAKPGGAGVDEYSYVSTYANEGDRPRPVVASRAAST